MLESFFNPKSVAVIGASTNPSKLGYAVLKNLLDCGYTQQGTLYPINPGAAEVLGVQAYPNVLEVPGAIDLAVIVIPYLQVPPALRQCGEKGIPAAVVISAGFREAGKEGLERELELIEIAKEFQIRLIGPNCLGVIDAVSNLNASFAFEAPPKGKISFITQSGALGTAVLDWAAKEDIGLSKFVSFGNKAGVAFVFRADTGTAGRYWVYSAEPWNEPPVEAVSALAPKRLVLQLVPGLPYRFTLDACVGRERLKNGEKEVEPFKTTQEVEEWLRLAGPKLGFKPDFFNVSIKELQFPYGGRHIKLPYASAEGVLQVLKHDHGIIRDFHFKERDGRTVLRVEYKGLLGACRSVRKEMPDTCRQMACAGCSCLLAAAARATGKRVEVEGVDNSQDTVVFTLRLSDW